MKPMNQIAMLSLNILMDKVGILCDSTISYKFWCHVILPVWGLMWHKDPISWCQMQNTWVQE